jgi:hypothetical protein
MVQWVLPAKWRLTTHLCFFLWVLLWGCFAHVHFCYFRYLFPCTDWGRDLIGGDPLALCSRFCVRSRQQLASFSFLLGSKTLSFSSRRMLAWSLKADSKSKGDNGKKIEREMENWELLVEREKHEFKMGIVTYMEIIVLELIGPILH